MEMIPPMVDPFELIRFLNAQDPIMEQVRVELQAGRKRSHWMWFVFPQFAGLGSSTTARYYAIASLTEARSYLGHPILGPRLIECTALINAVENRTALQIFGAPDDLKFRSSMTLFALARPDELTFSDALRKYFGGLGDPLTIEKLASP